MAKTTSQPVRMTAIDRRDYFRHTLVMPIACRRQGTRDTLSPTPAKIDLSGTGIRFSTTEFFRVGNRAEVLLALPSGAPIELTVEILRIQPDAADEAGYLVSGRFVGLPRRIQERLIQFLLRSQASRIQEAHVAESANPHYS